MNNIHKIVRRGDLESLKSLIISNPPSIDYQDKYGHTPLHIAAANGHLCIIKLLISVGAKLNVICDENQQSTCLHFAVKCKHVDCVRYLIKSMMSKGLRLDNQDKNGNTILHLAALTSTIMLNTVIENTFNCVSIKNIDGKSPAQLTIGLNDFVVDQLINRLYKDYDNKKFKYIINVPLKVLKKIMSDYLSLVDIINFDSAWTHFDTRSQLMNAYKRMHSVRFDIYPYHTLKSLRWMAKRMIDIKSVNLKYLQLQDNNPLHWACENNATDVFFLLLRTGNYDVNICNSVKRTPLHIACSNGDFILFDILTREYNANLNIQDNEGNTPLHLAVFNGFYELTQRLIVEFQCNLNFINNMGMTVLHIAAWKGRESICELILNEMKMKMKISKNNSGLLDVKDDSGLTALHIACSYKINKVFEILFENSLEDSTTIQNNDGQTPLFIACLHGHHEQVQKLLSHPNKNKIINIYDTTGTTPLHIACQNGFVPIAASLLEHGADVSIVNNDNNTVLHIACFKGDLSTSMVKLLVMNPFIDINARNFAGSTPLHICCMNGNLSFCKILLGEPLKGRCTCNVNIIDDQGWTPIFHAVLENHLDIVKFLIHECEAEISINDNNGLTPLMIAQSTTTKSGCKSSVAIYLEQQLEKTSID
jgi:ankyrin repeat protein